MDPFNQWGDENQHEQHELNERDPINYNQNYNQTYMTHDARETSVESLNIDSMQTKRKLPTIVDTRKSYHYEVPKDSNFWKYSEQIKSISAGLLLLFCGGMNTVWGIYQLVMYDSSKYFRDDVTRSNENSTVAYQYWIVEKIRKLIYPHGSLLKLTIIMYYAGIMLGCFVAGWFLVRVVQKKNIYYIAALLMFASGCVFYSAGVDSEDDPYWQTLILLGRFISGISYGLTYVTIFVQASENAAREFRRILATIIGLTLGFSVLFAAIFVISIPLPLEKLLEDDRHIVKDSELPSLGAISSVTIAVSFLAVVLNYFFSHETVPFLLYHNYREEEAVSMLGKLLGEDSNSAIVQQEFLGIRELCNDDFTEYPEGKIFTTVHRKLMSIPISARLASAQSLNILYVILIAKWLMRAIHKDELKAFEDLVDEDKIFGEKFVNDMEKISQLASDYRLVVRSEISAWFFSGLLFSLIANFLNWRRGLHFTTFLTGAIILTYSILSWSGSSFLHSISMFILTIYIHCLSLPIDILGYMYLMECFPLSTNAKAIGFVTICECLLNSFYAMLELKVNDVFIEFFLTGFIYLMLGFKLYCTVPNTYGLSLGAAKHAYVQSIFNFVWWKDWIPKRFYPAASAPPS